MQRVSLAGGWHDATGNSKGAGSQGHDSPTDCQVNWSNAVIDMAHRRGDNDRPEVLGHGFIEATTWGEGMSGDHNMHQKPRSYLDDFECPRCGHCCKAEWVGLTLNEAEDFYEKYTDRAELINAIDKFLEEKNT